MTGDKVWFLLTLIMAVVTSHQPPEPGRENKESGTWQIIRGHNNTTGEDWLMELSKLKYLLDCCSPPALSKTAAHILLLAETERREVTKLYCDTFCRGTPTLRSYSHPAISDKSPYLLRLKIIQFWYWKSQFHFITTLFAIDNHN